MAKKGKVSLATKYLSNRNYLNEVSVEGKKTIKFNFNIGHYDQYMSQIIRTGNCITLLSRSIDNITEDSFLNTNYFEDLSKYVFWTFNKSFLLKLIEKIQSLKLTILQRCAELLQENFVPYNNRLQQEDIDEELQWCFVKNDNLKKDAKYNKMYLVDKENRTVLLEQLKKRITEFPKPISETEASEKLTPVENELNKNADTILFLEVLKPIDGDTEKTLSFIKEKIEEAHFEFKVFSPISRLPNGKNPYGLNGCIAAMVDFFYQHNYFKKEYNLEEIFKAYLQYSGNTIGKLHTFLSEFREDKSYTRHLAKLKALKINKLT